MGKAPCCDKDNVKRGPWSPEEDNALKSYIHHHGTGGNWIALPKKAGLRRCGKSCRLRWLNYLRPDIRHGSFTEEEDMIIYTLYSQMGSRWSIIASQLHGRTDNDVKNHWNTKLKKKLLATKTNNIGEYPNPNDNPTLIGSTHFQPCTSNVENYTNLGFSALLTQDFQGTPMMLGGVNYGLTSQKFVHDPIHFTCPILPNLPQFNANAVENHIVSISQEASIGLDEKCVPWTSNNGGGGGDGILMDFGFGFSNEFVNGLWSLEKGGEGGAPNLVSSLGDSSHVLHADIKPQGLLQSVINH